MSDLLSNHAFFVCQKILNEIVLNKLYFIYLNFQKGRLSHLERITFIVSKFKHI